MSNYIVIVREVGKTQAVSRTSLICEAPTASRIGYAIREMLSYIKQETPWSHVGVWENGGDLERAIDNARLRYREDA